MHGFDYKELLLKFRYPVLILLVGLILVGGGYFLITSGLLYNPTKVEVLGTNNKADPDIRQGDGVTVEIAGEVIRPGVYTLVGGSRVDDALITAGGFSANADRDWCSKYLNRAAKITDGQKIYIPTSSPLDSVQSRQSNGLTANKILGDQTISAPIVMTGSDLVNINTASLLQLDTLPGIGQKYAQDIIEHRPYSNVSELLSKGVLKQSLYNKVKELVTIY